MRHESTFQVLRNLPKCFDEEMRNCRDAHTLENCVECSENTPSKSSLTADANQRWRQFHFGTRWRYVTRGTVAVVVCLRRILQSLHQKQVSNKNVPVCLLASLSLPLSLSRSGWDVTFCEVAGHNEQRWCHRDDVAVFAGISRLVYRDIANDSEMNFFFQSSTFLCILFKIDFHIEREIKVTGRERERELFSNATSNNLLTWSRG